MANLGLAQLVRASAGQLKACEMQPSDSDHRLAGSSPAGCITSPRAEFQAILDLKN